MGTTTIEARCNARPIRLAFILPRPDRDLLLDVITRATNLWGGIFNPIIILDDATRVARGVHHEMLPFQPYLERQDDILRSFDPDILVNYSNDPLPGDLKHFQHRTYPAARLDWNPWGRQEISYFVDVYPILDELWEREFKGNQSPRIKLRFLEKAASEASLFLAARYGMYSNDDAYEYLTKNFAAESFAYNAEFKAALKPDVLFSPLSITGFHCTTRRQHVHSHAFFLLNPEDPFDVMEYWNLRAAGVALLPFTLEDFKEFENPIRDFGAASAYPINENITNMPTIIKAPSITDKEHEEVTQWIGARGLVKQLSRMGWVPHSRRDMYGIANELEVDPIRAFEGNVISVLDEGHGTLQGPKPSFLNSQDRNQHWSMDMAFYTYGHKTASYKLPWLNSGCDALVRRKIGLHSEMNATHVSREGMVSQHNGDDSDVRLSPITSIEVVKAFLQGVGIEYVQTSGPGLALARILEMMGSFHSCEVLQNEAIRQTLEDMAKGDPRTVHSVKISLIQTPAKVKSNPELGVVSCTLSSLRSNGPDEPIVKKKEQNTPTFSSLIMTGLASWKKVRERVLFILCAATGLRIGEALGIEIDKHISPDFSTIYVRQKVRHGKVEKRLKTDNAHRDVDLHPLATRVLKDFVCKRAKGFLFCTRNGNPLTATNVIRRHLHPALKQLRYINPHTGTHKAGNHAFRRFRNTYLRNHTGCPDGLCKFWLGHADQDMSDLYDKIKEDVAFRKKWAEQCGLGFELPSVVPNVPKSHTKTKAQQSE